jgi:hypothetical protein
MDRLEPAGTLGVGGRDRCLDEAGPLEHGCQAVRRAQLAALTIEASGRLGGTLTNDGLVVLRGVMGGARTGSGSLRIEGNGYIKQPIIRDGIQYFEW